MYGSSPEKKKEICALKRLLCEKRIFLCPSIYSSNLVIPGLLPASMQRRLAKVAKVGGVLQIVLQIHKRDAENPILNTLCKSTSEIF